MEIGAAARRDGAMERVSRRRRIAVLVAAVLAVGAAVGVANQGNASSTTRSRPPMPQDNGVETKSGIRLTRVSLAADGGLIDVRYIVLDPSLATQWTGNTDKPPVISDQRSHKRLDRVAAMREGHDLRAGQTYYLIYLNRDSSVHRGDKIDLNIAGTILHNVTVE